ncbi:MAG: glycosyltransferase family 2 protein [Patescibacteria group bacterium]
MKLAIVIVSYNGLKYLPAALKSCKDFAPHCQVYLVENASSDGSLEYIQKNWPKVKLFPQATNLGFAEGNNVGLRQAMSEGAEAIFLLNQDAELTSGSLDKLESYLSTHPKVGMVQPRLSLPNGRINSLGNCYHYLGFGFAGGNGLSYEEALRRLHWFKNQTEIPYASGAGVLLRSQALKQVGLFDQTLFMYHEDLELSLRFRSFGWRLEILPEAEVIHHYQFSASSNNFYYMERNRLSVWLSYFKLPTLILLFIPWLISELALLLTSLFNGWSGAWWRARRYFFNKEIWQYLTSKRQQLRKTRKVNDRLLLSFASGSIHFQEKDRWFVRYLFNPLSAVGWLLIKPLIRW